MRIVIELRADVQPDIVLNKLYKHTQLQDSFVGCNNVDRAIYHLSQRGVKFDLDSKNVKNGKTVACYMADEIAGFAFHLVQA